MPGFFTFFILSGISTRAWINDLLYLSFLDTLLSKSTGLIPNFYLYSFVFVLAFFTAQWLIPQAIRLAHRFQLVDHPNLRKKK